MKYVSHNETQLASALQTQRLKMLLLALFSSIQQLSLVYPDRRNAHVNIYGVQSMSCLGRQMKNTVQWKDMR